jgi:hypothetical protein
MNKRAVMDNSAPLIRIVALGYTVTSDTAITVAV